MNSPTHPDVYTHGHHESVLRSHRWRTAENSAAYLLPALVPGTRLLDVGCGPGSVTIDLAARLEPGEVVGVDTSAAVVEIAQKAAADAGADNVTFQVADAYELPFPDDAFDVVHAHQVLQHLTDPIAALREMRRVTRPGGVVAVRDADYSGMTWYPQSDGLDEWLALYHEVTQANEADANAGRKLLSWVREAGFEPGRHRAQRRRLVLRHPRGPRLVGGAVGGPLGRLELRRAGHRARPRRRGRARAARRRVARVGQAARRLVRGAARRGAGARLN